MPTVPRPADLKLTGLVSSLRCCQLFSGLSGEDLATIAGFTQMLRLAKEGKPVRVVSDQVTAPTNTADIAEALLPLVRDGAEGPR